MEEAEKVFAELAAIPTLASGQFTSNDQEFEVFLNIKNYSNEFAKKTSYTVHSQSQHHLAEQSADVKFRSYSPDGKFLIIGKSEKKNSADSKANCSIEIWKDSFSLVASVSLSEVHGDFCLDEVFGSLSWSPNGKSLIYVAEKKAAEKKGLEKYSLQENFGERLNNIRETVICMLDIDKVQVRILDLNLAEGYMPSQPVFSDDSTIFFTGIRIGSKKLGMFYIYCRPTAIFMYDLTSKQTQMISDSSTACRSPLGSRDGQTIAYLSNSLAKSHFKCSKLMLYERATGKTRVLVDIVKDPRCGFPGLFVPRLPAQRFVKKLYMASCWGADRPIISVDIDAGAVERLFSDIGEGSFRILDSRADKLLLSHSTPVLPAQIYHYDTSSNVLKMISFSHFQHEVLKKSVTFKVKELNNHVNIVLIQPTNRSPQEQQLIILPHGGPNSVYSVDYILYPAALASLGFAVASINYTGSIGFGDDSIEALEGNIGVRDVEDCFLSMEMLVKTERFDRRNVWVMGGSHGGYLTALLSAKYPTNFKGAILRNPVIDLPSMLVTSDIADWTFGQLGLDYDQVRSRAPTADETVLMRERSPSTYAESVKCPSLVLLGAQDVRVHPTQGLYWANLLKANNVQTSIFWYPDANHGLDTAEAEKFGFLAIINFLFANL